MHSTLLMFVFIVCVVELGVKSDSNTSKGRQLSVYEEYFEEDFIRHTERFYASESVTFLANNPITEYLKRVGYSLALKSACTCTCDVLCIYY